MFRDQSVNNQHKENNSTLNRVQSDLWCHQCKRKSEKVVFCDKLFEAHPNKESCNGKYCETCIRRHYNTTPEILGAEKEWICFKCQGACLCANCRRERGEDIPIKRRRQTKKEELKLKRQQLLPSYIPPSSVPAFTPVGFTSYTLQQRDWREIPSNRILEDITLQDSFQEDRVERDEIVQSPTAKGHSCSNCRAHVEILQSMVDQLTKQVEELTNYASTIPFPSTCVPVYNPFFFSNSFTQFAPNHNLSTSQMVIPFHYDHKVGEERVSESLTEEEKTSSTLSTFNPDERQN